MTAVYYQVRPNGGTDESLWLTVPAASLPQVVGSLAAGSFQVRALGASAWTSAVTVIDAPEEFDPVALFGASDVGFLMDFRAGPADLWQDTAGTTPVTAAGQSVALAGRLGAAGLRRFSQGTSGSRPVYGVDAGGGHIVLNGSAFLVMDSPNWNGADNVTLAALYEPTGSDTTRQTVAGWRSTTSNNYVVFDAPGAAAGGIRLERRAGTTSGSATTGTPATWLATHSLIFRSQRVGSGHQSSGVFNGATAAPGAVGTGTGTFNTQAWEIGRNPTANDRPAFGKLRALLAISRILTASEETAVQAWLTP
jgi:hypothetical protein